MSDQYPSNSKQWTESFLAVSNNRLLDVLRRRPQAALIREFVADRQAEILDVGCGAGAFLRILKDMGYARIQGVEPNQGLIDHLRGKNPELGRLIEQGTAEAVPCPDASRDVICFLNVLHHLEDAAAYRTALAEADRCLRPGGLVLLVEPCRKWIYSAKRNCARLFGSFSSFFAGMYAMMEEERILMERFIDHEDLFRRFFVERRYAVLKDSRPLHQWFFVARKNA